MPALPDLIIADHQKAMSLRQNPELKPAKNNATSSLIVKHGPFGASALAPSGTFLFASVFGVQCNTGVWMIGDITC